MFKALIRALLLTGLGLSSNLSVVNAQEYFGTFQGDLIVKALKGGRNLELTHPFAFLDPKGKLWSVPAGTIVDGASIPQAFWSIIGGPFEDKYREASVIHDHYCDRKTETWENVHLAFYHGMRARGVGSIKAKIMYAAVYNFGPRWVELSTPSLAKSLRGEPLLEPAKLISGEPILLNDAKEAILRFIAENDPSIEKIHEISARLTAIENIEQLEKILYESANCTPILTNPSSKFPVNRTLVLCGLSVTSKKNVAIMNMRTLVTQLYDVLYAQWYRLLPFIDDYIREPTAERWPAVTEWSRNVRGLVKLGIKTVLDIDDERAKAIAPSLDDIFGTLNQRITYLTVLSKSEQPMTREQMTEWARTYKGLIYRLERRLTELEDYVNKNFQ